MRALAVVCKACGRTFGTGILLGVYGRPVLGPATFPCPHCRSAAAYGNEDYRAEAPAAGKART